jgi:hypothetical protein
MAISSKIFEALTAAIKMNDTITSLADDVKNLAKETRELDRCLIRLETFVEIAEKQRKLTPPENYS